MQTLRSLSDVMSNVPQQIDLPIRSLAHALKSLLQHTAECEPFECLTASTAAASVLLPVAADMEYNPLSRHHR